MKTLALAVSTALLLFFAGSCSKSDSVTSPTLSQEAKSSECDRECLQEHQEAVQEENQRFREDLRECRGDDDDDDACVADARALHASILIALEAEVRACRRACEHDQGGGFGGQATDADPDWYVD